MLTTASSAVLHATRSSVVLAGLVPALGVGLRAQLGDGLGHHEAHALADYLSAEALCAALGGSWCRMAGARVLGLVSTEAKAEMQPARIHPAERT